SAHLLPLPPGGKGRPQPRAPPGPRLPSVGPAGPGGGRGPVPARLRGRTVVVSHPDAAARRRVRDRQRASRGRPDAPSGRHVRPFGLRMEAPAQLRDLHPHGDRLPVAGAPEIPLATRAGAFPGPILMTKTEIRNPKSERRPPAPPGGGGGRPASDFGFRISDFQGYRRA